MQVTFAITADGITYATGSAVATGGVPAIPTGGFGRQTGSVRRFGESGGMRRVVRR